MTDIIDIDDLALTETDEMAILHPVTRQPTGWVWTIAGLSHPATIEQRNKQDREQKLARRRLEVSGRNRPSEPDKSPEVARLEMAEAVGARVVGWNTVRMNGADFPYSPENVVKILLDLRWDRVYAQLMQFLADETSFTQRSEPK